MSPGPESDDRGYLTRYAKLPEVGWGGTTILVGVLIATAAVIVGSGIVLAFDSGLETQGGLFAAQLVIGLALGGTAIGLALADSGGDRRGALHRLGLRRVALSMLGLAALAWLAYSILSLTAGSLLDPQQDPVTDELGTDEDSVLSVLGTALLVIPVAALSEELFFRGFMFRALRNSGASLWPAALISSAVWSALHLAAGNLGVVAILGAFGLVLAWLYERSGSLWIPIAAHALNNTVAFVILLAA
jgi:membrane protease YdiL (CAAX protease family)